jgi:hypothetical protein
MNWNAKKKLVEWLGGVRFLCLVHLVALFSRKLLKFIGVTRMCAAANGKFNIIIASRNGM